MDETYHGGKRRGRFAAMQGVARVASDASKKTLYGTAKEYILPKSTVFNEWSGYDGPDAQGYVHRRIRHRAKVYVMGDAHTNTIEGVWSRATPEAFIITSARSTCRPI